MDQLRSSVLHKDEVLEVIYTGKAGNFPKNTPIPVHSRMACRSGLPYPEPKWVACDYYIIDTDGDRYQVARDRYGKLEKGFEWVNNTQIEN